MEGDDGRDRPPKKSSFQKLKREQRSLLCFVKALVGHLVVIETRDDVTTRGTLVDVDDGMNCVLEDAQRVTPEQALEKKRDKFERMFVRARLIRYVHVPTHVDPSFRAHRAAAERRVRRVQALPGQGGVRAVQPFAVRHERTGAEDTRGASQGIREALMTIASTKH